MKLKLNKYAAASAAIYRDGLLEFCERENCKPLVLLVESDEALDPLYERLRPRARQAGDIEPEELGEIHFMIGWLTGCAESHGMSIEAFWAQLVLPAKAAKPKPASRRVKKAA